MMKKAQVDPLKVIMLAVILIIVVIVVISIFTKTFGKQAKGLDQTVEELSKRTNNVARTNITAIMNGIDEYAKFKDEQTVKIVTMEKYFKK